MASARSSFDLDAEVRASPSSPAALAAHMAATAPSRRLSAAEGESCVICGERARDVHALVRGCQSGARPCEGAECACKAPYAQCLHCFAQQLWASTPSVMRARGEFRTRCAFCKAEVCERDVVMLKSSGRA